MLDKIRGYLFDKLTMYYVKRRYEYIQLHKEVYGTSPKGS